MTDTRDLIVCKITVPSVDGKSSRVTEATGHAAILATMQEGDNGAPFVPVVIVASAADIEVLLHAVICTCIIEIGLEGALRAFMYALPDTPLDTLVDD